MLTTTRSPARVPPPWRRDRRLAWACLALLPVALVAAMLVGEALLAAQGHSGTDGVPLGVVALASLPALAVLLSSPAGAVWFGLRAQRHGSDSADPVLAGLVVGAVLVAMNLVPLLLGP